MSARYEVMFTGRKSDSRGRRAYVRMDDPSYGPWLQIRVSLAERMLRKGSAVDVSVSR